jgi:hypothetical protein
MSLVHTYYILLLKTYLTARLSAKKIAGETTNPLRVGCTGNLYIFELS